MNSTDKSSKQTGNYENVALPEKIVKKSDRILLHQEAAENELPEKYHDVM